MASAIAPPASSVQPVKVSLRAESLALFLSTVSTGQDDDQGGPRPVDASFAHEHNGDSSVGPVLAHDRSLVPATRHGADRARMEGRGEAQIEFAQRLIPMSYLGLAVDVCDMEISTGGLER